MGNLKVCIEKAKEALEQKEDIMAELDDMGDAIWTVVCGDIKLTIHIEKSDTALQNKKV